uniref:Uncharacterized protein n=1 Tax=Acanthochromis polyacanthus TaxID=80966 RepID=A0A3Q1EUQ8_9TELE
MSIKSSLLRVEQNYLVNGIPESSGNYSCFCSRLSYTIEYNDAGITNTHYIRVLKGEIYGADHSVVWFCPDPSATVRPQTPLKNLYLTSQDMLVCGFTFTGALTCGSVIPNHNLHLEAIVLAKKTKFMKETLKEE